MRHGKKFNHLGRTASHRKAMLSNMAASLVIHKRINTTVAKAKALKKYVEPLVTRAKLDSIHNRRMVFSYLQSKEAVTELFKEVSLKVSNRLLLDVSQMTSSSCTMQAMSFKGINRKRDDILR